ncbi:MAG: 3-phosphoshikimate 1-carboxyvinyltransferase [Ferruginibacter sp.]
MIAAISPSGINGTITARASKSAMQRACALALLNNGNTVIQNPGNSNDDRAAINIIKGLGATIGYENDQLLISSSGEIKGGMIDCAESGLSLRMFAAIAALSKSRVILNGRGSLLKRPVHFFDVVFPSLNVSAKTNEGFLPVSIQGPMVPADISIDGSMSSQYLTGLLFAFAKAADKPVVITVNNLKSKPYIDLSLKMLEHFGYLVRNESYLKFYIEPGEQKGRNIIYYTEADWSGAAFMLVAAAIAGDIRVKGLDIYSTQADRAIMDVLVEVTANVSVDGSCILVNDQHPLKAFEFDATDCPDLFPPLVSLAAYCNGPTVIKGTSRLAGKESNRAETLKDVFGKMGIEITLKEDVMIIHGGTGVQAADVSSHDDHRVAMACAVAALKASGTIRIHDAEAVNKSYPGFYDHLQMLGAAVSLTNQ